MCIFAGNLIADSMVWDKIKDIPDYWSNVSIAIMNGGGIRASIVKGILPSPSGRGGWTTNN